MDLYYEVGILIHPCVHVYSMRIETQIKCDTISVPERVSAAGNKNNHKNRQRNCSNESNRTT